MRIVIATSDLKNEGKRLATGIFVCHTDGVLIYLHARMHRFYALLGGAWVNEFREDGPIYKRGHDKYDLKTKRKRVQRQFFYL